MTFGRSARRGAMSFLACVVFLSGGCGYTTRSLLPSDIKTIYVENFKNMIPVTAEQTNVRMYRGYRPGMETELTRAVINRYVLDGNLRIAGEKEADIVLAGELIDFRQEPLRYDNNDNIEEYRVKVIVNIQLKDTRTGKTMWVEDGFAGESTYRTSGSLGVSEDAGVAEAMVDISRRIVERTIEVW